MLRWNRVLNGGVYEVGCHHCPGGHPQPPNPILTVHAGLPTSPSLQLEKLSLKAACCKRAPNSPLRAGSISPGEGWRMAGHISQTAEAWGNSPGRWQSWRTGYPGSVCARPLVPEGKVDRYLLVPRTFWPLGQECGGLTGHSPSCL